MARMVLWLSLPPRPIFLAIAALSNAGTAGRIHSGTELVRVRRSQRGHRLVTSHLRLVIKIAKGYRGYGLPISDVISEGNVGVMQALERFEPEKGFRLATYAAWWIRAAIQARTSCAPGRW